MTYAPRAGGTGAITPEALRAAKDMLQPPRDVPPAAFYFKVAFGASGLQDDTSFQEVSGIGSTMETEEVVEGGENRFVHHLPKGVKQTPLVLKRSIGRTDSALVRWCRAVLEGGLALQVMTAPLTVYLMDAYGKPVRAWQFANTFPIKWDVDSFNSTKNELAVESITLQYSYSNRII